MKNRIAALSLALALTVGLCAPAQAAENQNVKATQSGGVTVTYQGREQAFTDANNVNVLPIIYDGTTYLPVRAVANLAGLGVGWDGGTSTVSLTTKGQQKSYDGDFDAGNTDVDVTISKGMTVTLDGAVKSFTDAKGTAVYPITFNGTTYLPVRAVCGLVNMDVDWDQASSTVKLGAPKAIAPGEIPAGALPLTGGNVTLKGETVRGDEHSRYEDGKFILINTLDSECAAINFINDGYTALTFTLTTPSDKIQRVNVCGRDSIISDRRLSKYQDPGTAETYTVDISGIKDISLSVGNGIICTGAIITDIYLT